MKNLICAMSIALAAGVALAEDLTVSEDTTINETKEYDNVTFSNNATLTIESSSSKTIDFKVTTSLTGTGTIVLDKGRLGLGCDVTDTTITCQIVGNVRL